jgi:DNA repair exonuclease SbcCD nuclease subunit
MTFRFIHTADWQLGKPFANFPADVSGVLQAARFSAISRISEIATARGASYVLVAGDVFDSDDLPNSVLRRGLERMAECSQTQWLLLPGNHDAARAGGVWDRIQRFGVPANVTLILTAEPLALTDGVTILPAPLTTKNPGRDPTQWMDAAPSPAGVVRIGLAHGSVQGFGSDGESSVLIARDRAVTAGLAYLALGDWHGVSEVGARTWYSGTPEPDRFPNNEPGNVLSVCIGQNAALTVEKVPSSQFDWAKIVTSLNSAADISAIEDKIAKALASPSRALVRLTLSGSFSMSDHARLSTWIDVWSARLRFLSVDQAALALRPTDEDFGSLRSSPLLLEAAHILAAAAADPSHPDHGNAPLALQRLFGFAAEAALQVGV